MTMPSTSTPEVPNIPVPAAVQPPQPATPPAPAPATPPVGAGVSSGQLELGAVAAGATPVARIPTRKLVADADEDLPNDADLIEMSPALLKKRLERFSRKQLRDRFGTEDMDAVKKDLDELATLRAEAEQRRMASLTETEQLREQVMAATRRAEQAEQRAEQVMTERVVAEQDQSVMAIMKQHINPRYLKHESRNLAEYVSGLSEAELADPEATIEAWCKQAISEDPALGIPQQQPEAAPGAALQPAPGTPVRPAVPVPVSNGANVQRPGQASPGGAQGPASTYAPGRSNSASDREWRELKRANNWNF